MECKNPDLLRDEFIGKNVKENITKTNGKIIDETKNTFLIKTKEKRRRILKKNKIFEISFGNKIVSIPGNLITLRPEDRIKIKKWQ